MRRLLCTFVAREDRFSHDEAHLVVISANMYHFSSPVRLVPCDRFYLQSV